MNTEINNLNSSPSASQQQITPVQRKLQKILDLKLESDKDLIESLKYLSSFFNENSVRTRRSLRSTIEKRSLTLNDQFEECFRQVKQQLDQLNNTVTSMSTCCEDMTQRLKVK
jgi:aspartate carbamoyltransferase catalytic subunit